MTIPVFDVLQGNEAAMIVRVLAIALTLSLPAAALMPPHISSSDPQDGGVLEGDTLVFHGYSLAFGEEVKVADAAGEPVQVTQQLTCTGEGDCCEADRRDEDLRVGCCQQRCELRVTLSGVVPGATYRATVLGATLVFTAAARASPLQTFLESPLELAQFKRTKGMANSGGFQAPAWLWRPSEKGFHYRYMLFPTPRTYSEGERFSGFTVIVHKQGDKVGDYKDGNESLVAIWCRLVDPDLGEANLVGLRVEDVESRFGPPDTRMNGHLIYMWKDRLLSIGLTADERVEWFRYARVRQALRSAAEIPSSMLAPGPNW